MLGLKKVAFFQYPVSDVQRARTFYEGLLGFAVEYANSDFSWYEYALPGSTFAITNCVPGQTPGAAGGSLALEVDHLEATLEDLRERGVFPVTELFETQVCKMAVIADPDGNRIVLHQLTA